MTTLSALDRLEAIEEIRQLKYRYFRCLDTKDWDGLADTLTEDASSAYDSGKYSYEGREAILTFLREALGDPKILSRHQGHHPEIELTGESSARGRWYLEDQVIFGNLADSGDEGVELSGAGFYEDEYAKVGGAWKIRRTGYVRTYEQFAGRAGVQSLRTMFDSATKQG